MVARRHCSCTHRMGHIATIMQNICWQKPMHCVLHTFPVPIQNVCQSSQSLNGCAKCCRGARSPHFFYTQPSGSPSERTHVACLECQVKYHITSLSMVNRWPLPLPLHHFHRVLVCLLHHYFFPHRITYSSLLLFVFEGFLMLSPVGRLWKFHCVKHSVVACSTGVNVFVTGLSINQLHFNVILIISHWHKPVRTSKYVDEEFEVGVFRESTGSANRKLNVFRNSIIIFCLSPIWRSTVRCVRCVVFWFTQSKPLTEMDVILCKLR